MRISRIHKHFLLVVVLFSFLTLVIHLIPMYYEFENNFYISMNLPRYLSDDVRRKVARKRKPELNIWKIAPGDDRIVNQMKFKPEINDSIPRKRILIDYGVSGWGLYPGDGVFIDQNCPVKHCELTDKSSSYDARLFKGTDLDGYRLKRLMKEPRDPNQVWILFNLEGPLSSPDFSGGNHIINWTASYRPDSTIVAPYEKWVHFDNFTHIDKIKPSRNYLKGKTKMAAMFVTNCGTQNKRMTYAHELQRYMEVDIYGACGTHSCGRDREEECFNMLSKDYKFYLSFENSNCRHYITEKFFVNALRHDVIPVVMGAHPVDYKRAAPPGSYIHVEDFRSPKELAEYLVKLAKNEELYNQYFRWHGTGHFINTKFWCRVCAMLWDPKRPRLSVPIIKKWWNRHNTCIGDKRWDNITAANKDTT